MRIGVIEHRLRGGVQEDELALVEASEQASANRLDVLFFPQVAHSVESDRESLTSRLEGLPGTRLVPRFEPHVRAHVLPVTEDIPVVGERLGRAVLIHGDACFDPAVLERVAAAEPAVLVMTPMSESELQAEAALELAIGLSESVAGLVIVAESVGAEPGEPGHGGSAIVMLGKVLAEAIGDEGDLLIAEIPEPVPMPEPPEPIPQVPTILAQRLANHEGRHLDMGYLADLSEGPGYR